MDRQSAAALDTRDDVALARRCACDSRAREALFRSHAQGLYRVAKRIVGNRADAEDVLQEAFVEVYSWIHTYRGEAPLAAWLRRVTVRCACRHRRRRRPMLSLKVVDASTEVPDVKFASRAALRRLDQLLQRLSDRRRVMFVLHEVEGYSLADAAAMMGITVRAAKNLAWRARGELQRLAERDAELRVFYERDATDD